MYALMWMGRQRLQVNRMSTQYSLSGTSLTSGHFEAGPLTDGTATTILLDQAGRRLRGYKDAFSRDEVALPARNGLGDFCHPAGNHHAVP